MTKPSPAINWKQALFVILVGFLCLSAGLFYKAKSVQVHERNQCYTKMEEAGCIEIDWENKRLIPKCVYFNPEPFADFPLNITPT